MTSELMPTSPQNKQILAARSSPPRPQKVLRGSYFTRSDNTRATASLAVALVHFWYGYHFILSATRGLFASNFFTLRSVLPFFAAFFLLAISFSPF
jgi:hypothetical protein